MSFGETTQAIVDCVDCGSVEIPRRELTIVVRERDQGEELLLRFLCRSCDVISLTPVDEAAAQYWGQFDNVAQRRVSSPQY